MNCITQNLVKEWSFSSKKQYSDSFNEVEVEVIFSGPDGMKQTVPAFWDGGNIWRVRFSSPVVGKYHYRTVCSDTDNPELHIQEGEFEVTPYHGVNHLFQHGPLRLAPDKRHLQHHDGTPFFWLGDTWWMGLCHRLEWPQDFQKLTFDRIEKGFTLIQIVAGLYPDMPQFDERGANEVGYPWEKDFSRINPAYFDLADRRIDYLVQVGLVPCIVGCWGYFLGFMGVENMKKHWRNLVARYGAYPVIWCLAGEATMGYYLSEDRSADMAKQKKGWTELARYVRQINAFNNPVTIHPTQFGREQVEDPSLIDIDMLQTGHGSYYSFANTVKSLKISLEKEPKMPVLVGEVCYEGILEGSREELQRIIFWSCILSGAAGHTYGANGIWQVNRKDKPFGPSPHGNSWGDRPWDEAAQLNGSKNLGIAKKLLERYPWWQFEPHQEWIEVSKNLGIYAKDDEYFVPYAGGIPRKVRIIYSNPFLAGFSKVKHLESDVKYRAFHFNPSDGSEINQGEVIPDSEGNWQPPRPPIFRDWVLVLEAV